MTEATLFGCYLLCGLILVELILGFVAWRSAQQWRNIIKRIRRTYKIEERR